MNFHVTLTAKCELDIAEAALWWGEHRDVQQAIAWFEGIHKALAALCENPERFAVIHEQALHDWGYTYRQILYGVSRKPTHRAVFRIDGQTVYVVAVRHLSRRDLEPADLGEG